MLKCFNQASNFLGLQIDPTGSNSKENNLLDIFNNKPFYFELQDHNGIDDCFNCTIGLPRKNNQEYPLFDYEKLIIDSIQNNQHVWIKKSRGIGVTELILRYLAWVSLATKELEGKSIFLVSGTRENFANDIKIRLERLFERKFPNLKFESKYTELWLNKTWVKVFPTKRIQDLRGYTDVSYLWIDESDFFDPAEQWELEYVIKAYEEKSKCKIILTSTPNKPDSLFHKIERNEIFKDFFKKIFLDYTYGLGKIYDTQFIEREKNEPYFQREYCLAYSGLPGNLYSQSSIDKAVALGELYNPEQYRIATPKFITVDSGFASSRFAIMGAEWDQHNKQLKILHSEELDRPLYEDSISRIFEIRKRLGNVLNIGVDSSNPELISSLKKKIGERYDYNYLNEKINYCKKYSQDLSRFMIVVPIAFNTESKTFMTSHSRRMLDDSQGLIAINKKFSNLITALRGAIFDDRGHLDKDSSVFDDTLDCFQMLCTFFRYKTADRDTDKVNILSL